MTKRTEWDYIVPVKMPVALKGVEPGKLHASLLRDIPGGGKLFYLAADAWLAMVEAAKADGVELKPTSSGDLYRSYDSQKAGFLTRYQLQPIPGQSTKTFEGKTWYLKKGMAMLATPGKSQHNLGLAVDVHSASEKKRMNWLIANVEKFGWSWEVVPSEPWHIRYVCGDAVPQAVKDYVARNPKPGSPFGSVADQKATVVAKTATPAANVQAAAKKRVVKQGSAGPLVKEAQTLLVKHGFVCKVDGDFGPKTAQLIKNFQNKNGIPATGEVDQATWSVLLG
jgi:hypothetical protein